MIPSMDRGLFALVIAVLGACTAPSFAQPFTIPEIGLQTSGACRQFAVRDRESKAMVPVGCMSSGKGRLEPDSLQILGAGSTGDASKLCTIAPWSSRCREAAEPGLDTINALDGQAPADAGVRDDVAIQAAVNTAAARRGRACLPAESAELLHSLRAHHGHTDRRNLLDHSPIRRRGRHMHQARRSDGEHGRCQRPVLSAGGHTACKQKQQGDKRR